MGFLDRFRARKEKQKNDETLVAFAAKAQAFAEANPDVLVILGDPATDAIFMTYKGIAAPIRILNKDGSRNYIVRNALRHGAKDADIDRMLLAVDGGLYTIAKVLHSNQKAKLTGKVLSWVGELPPPVKSAVELADGSQLSPIQLVDGNDEAL